MAADGGFGWDVFVVDAKRGAGFRSWDGGEVVFGDVLVEWEKSGGSAEVSFGSFSSLVGSSSGVAALSDISPVVMVVGDFSSGAGLVGSTGGHRRSRSLKNGSLSFS